MTRRGIARVIVGGAAVIVVVLALGGLGVLVSHLATGHP